MLKLVSHSALHPAPHELSYTTQHCPEAHTIVPHRMLYTYSQLSYELQLFDVCDSAPTQQLAVCMIFKYRLMYYYCTSFVYL